MLGLKLKHVSKRGHWGPTNNYSLLDLERIRIDQAISHHLNNNNNVDLLSANLSSPRLLKESIMTQFTYTNIHQHVAMTELPKMVYNFRWILGESTVHGGVWLFPCQSWRGGSYVRGTDAKTQESRVQRNAWWTNADGIENWISSVQGSSIHRKKYAFRTWLGFILVRYRQILIKLSTRRSYYGPSSYESTLKNTGK